jgi:PAS domain S-box-containing protein
VNPPNLQTEWFRTSLFSIGDGVIATDTEGRIVFLNPVAEALTKWSVADAIGRPLTEVFEVINEETRLAVTSPVDRILKEGVIVGLANHTILIARDGTELMIDESAAPIRDDAGELRGVILVFRDVTEKRRTERALAESDERFRLLVEGTMDYAIFMLDPEGKVISWNAGARNIKGYEAEEIIGQHFSRFYPQEAIDRGWPDTELERAAEDGRFEDEGWRVRKDGSQFWANVVITALRDKTGRLRGFSKVTRNLTERREREEALRQLHAKLEERVRNRTAELQKVNAQLEEADRRKDEFLAMLAHELRNPLAPIKNGVEIMKLVGDSEPTLVQAREMIGRQVQHLTRLVDDLLDVSRITRGKISLQAERIELAGVVARAVETSGPLVESRRQHLSLTLPQKAVAVRGDITRLAQVVSNLLNNAAKYTPEEGHIWLKVEQNGEEALISVRDDGVGIPANLLPHVFDMFVQGDRTPARSEGGLGIGLTLVKSLVAMHGGTVVARSDGYGRGSEFTIHLPAEKVKQESVKPPSRPTMMRTGRRVLVVDDNKDSADSLAMLLRMLGHVVQTANDGPTGLSAAAEHKPEVVLLDIGLPGMDGYEVALQLRRMEDLKGITVVAMTGYGQEEDRRRTLEAGFDHHVTKPADPDLLQRLIVGGVPSSPLA